MDNLKVTDRLPDGVYVVFQWCRVQSIGGLVGRRVKKPSVTTPGNGRGVVWGENLVSNYASKMDWVAQSV